MRKSLLALSTACILLSGCQYPDTSPAEPSAVRKGSTANVIDYGNGVLYFASVRASFANALSTYLQEHPTMEVAAIAGDAPGAHGQCLGYFVVLRQKM